MAVTEHEPVPANQYLEGNFAPVSQEITATDLTVIGEIPLAFEGRYVRNGPNPAGPES